MKVKARLRGGDTELEALHCEGGLAVFKLPDGAFSVTHVASGYRVGRELSKEEHAIAAMKALVALPISWKEKDEKVLAGQIKEKKLEEVVRDPLAKLAAQKTP